MGIIEKFNQKTCFFLEKVAGFALVCVSILTGCDIVGRIFGRPIPGTYEIVSFSGGIVVGLAIPAVSLARAHVRVDLIFERCAPVVKSILLTFNRLIGAALIVLLTYSIVQIGNDLRTSGEVSPVLHFSFYPVAYGIAVALVFNFFVLIGDFFRKGA